jgi:hypothetical protein
METRIRIVKTTPAKLAYIAQYQSIKYTTDPEFRAKKHERIKNINRNRYQNDPEYRANKQASNREYALKKRIMKLATEIL